MISKGARSPIAFQRKFKLGLSTIPFFQVKNCAKEWVNSSQIDST